ncbi:MAG: hypothetical protein Kow00127_16060 [Bacteroidales bacterium]
MIARARDKVDAGKPACKKGKINFHFTLLILLLTVSLIPGFGLSQTGDVSVSAGQLWSEIEPELQKTDTNTSFSFIPEKVRQKCQGDSAAMIAIYGDLIYRLERAFNLRAAVFVGDELLKIAHAQKNDSIEALAHLNQHRFYNALGNQSRSIFHLEKAISLSQNLKNKFWNRVARFYKVLESLEYLTFNDVSPQVESLIEESHLEHDTMSLVFLQASLVDLSLNEGLTDLTTRYLDELDKLEESFLLRKSQGFHGQAPQWYQQLESTRLKILGCRANLALSQKDLNRAEELYRQLAELSRQKPDKWIEIDALHHLAAIVWDKKNPDSAKALLKEAQLKAEKLNLHDLLSENYRLSGMIAEQENRYQDALRYYKLHQYHDSIHHAESAGFDLRRYYLQSENEKLQAEEKNKELELKLKNIQLRNIQAITLLSLLLVAGLITGLYKQHKGKKQLAEQKELIEIQAEKLKSLDEAKSRFFANVSHELRTPLTLIMGPVDSLLNENRLTDKQTQLLKLVKQNSRHLNRLVNEILDLRKLESGKLLVHREPADLHSFGNRYLVQYKSLADRQNIRYNYSIQPSGDLIVELDTEKTRQIIYNLISNAFKFTPAGGSINVDIVLNNDRLTITVTDTGKGIPPEDIPHVFDRYFQTTRPDAPMTGGTGIGLALCKEYANLFGGDISVESEPGKGTKFTVSFPVTVQEDIPPAALSTGEEEDDSTFSGLSSESDETDNSGEKSTILVVEDNPVLQQYISLILSDRYHVAVADNGRIALEYLESHPGCDMVISDLIMPEMDGYQLIEHLKSSEKTWSIPVIMLTARSELADRMTALHIGVDDYLNKPFNEGELKVRIHNLLKRRKVRLSTMKYGNRPKSGSESVIPGEDKFWLERFEAYVREHIADETLSVPGMAEHFAMSESTLRRQVKRLIGMSPNQYVMEIRLDEARKLIENQSYSNVQTIALKVGYSNLRTFSRSYKQRFGKTPSEMMVA